MELKDIASVNGKGGLFMVVKPTRTGVILESIDDTKTKFIAGANHKVSLLKEISIYTTTKEGSIPLEDVFKKIKSEFGDGSLPVNNKSNNNELNSFIAKVIPDYDVDRVYPSDIKKLAAWYEILNKYASEILVDTKPEAPKAAEKEVKAAKSKEKASEEVADKKPAKKAAPKKTSEK